MTLAASVVTIGLSATAAQAHGTPNGTAAARSDHMRAHAELERMADARARTPQGRRELRSARSFKPIDKVRPVRGRARARASVEGLPLGVAGKWGERFQLPTPAVHMVQLPTGKVLFFGERRVSENQAHAWLYDPSTRGVKEVHPPNLKHPTTGKVAPANIWCSGQSLLPDGRVLVSGGTLDYQLTNGSRYTGLKTLFTFNPYNETWTRQPDMEQGRWYPTNTLMPNGETVIMGGNRDTVDGPLINQDVEVFTPSADLDGVGTIRRVQAASGVESPNKEWYPHTFVMRSGRALLAGPDPQMSWYLDGFGRSTYDWTDAPNPSSRRNWSSAVLMPSDERGGTQAMQVGGAPFADGTNDGTRQSLASTETFDETTNSWSASGSMNVRRGHHNTVLLPDASMVTVGGGIGKAWVTDSTGKRKFSEFPTTEEHKQIEIRDPKSGQWSLGPAHVEPRSYHSTAVLLPDGRVFSAGDNGNGPEYKLTDYGEIYSPAYLFRGPRPTISAAPASVGYGGAFTVETPDADVSKAVLVAPGATTHGTDMNQRHLTLPTTRRADGRGIDVVAPSGPNAAPPGAYMLFVLNADGVPSVAKWVRVGSADVEPLPYAATGPGVPPAPNAPAPTTPIAPAAPSTPSAPATPPPASRPAVPVAPRPPAARPSKPRVTVGSLLRSGLSVPVRCARACTVTVRLSVDRAAKRRYRLRSAVIGSKVVRLRRAGTSKAVVRPTALAKRRLRRARSLRLRVEVRTAARGATAKRSLRRVTLSR